MTRLLIDSLLAAAQDSLALRDLSIATMILTGLACQALRRRMRPGLGTSLFAGLTTIAVTTAIWWHGWTPGYSPYFVVRVSSLLVLFWALLGLMARRAEPSADKTASLSDSTTFFAWSLVTGIAVLVQVFYVVTFRSLSRVLEPNLLEDIPGDKVLTSFWDVVLLLAAVLLWRSARPHPAQPGMALGLSILLVWLSGLLLPERSAAGPRAATSVDAWRPDWWDWTIQLQAGLALVLLVEVILQDRGYRRRRNQAWPDHLDDLLLPYPRWPSLVRLQSLAAGAILVLGVYQLVRLGSAHRALGLANFFSCLVAGWTSLFLCYRRWSGNTAGLGMGLLTLAAAQLFALAASMLTPDAAWRDYASRIPVLFNAVLFALALMIGWWRWLAAFWRQQLLDGRDWTTAGRLIPYARRTAFFLTALALLVSFHMALWPRLAPIGEDDGAGRITFGLLGIVLILLISARKARRDDSVTSAAMAVALVVGAILFVFIRLPTSPLRGWLKQYDEVVLGSIALPTLLIAEALPASRWRSFAAPLWILALLFLPAASLVGLLSPDQPVEWIRPMTLAVLGALYSFAGRREHRRAFLVLGGVLLLASVTTLIRGYGRTLVSAVAGA